MPRHVEGYHPIVLREVGVAELVTVLAVIGAGGVQAHHGNAFAVLFVIGAVSLPFALDIDIAPDDWIMLVHDFLLSLRLVASAIACGSTPEGFAKMAECCRQS
jgi:hypothetical protein